MANLPPSQRKRTLWRGLLAAVIGHVATLIAFSVMFFFLKPFVWHAFSNAPYPSAQTPVDSNSTEWLVLQFGNFLTWFVAGVAAARWAPPRSITTHVVLIAAILLMMQFAPAPGTESTWRQALWWCGTPIALALGSVTYYLKRDHQAQTFGAVL
jgi:predicted MFS family arabinose efflux permease